MAFTLGPRASSAGYRLESFDQIRSTKLADVAPATAATLGFAAGLALEAALRGVAGPAAISFSLKWPNDVLAGQAKLSGILLEAETLPGGSLAVVVGMGTNIVAAPGGTPTPATSLAALGVETSAEQLFAGLSDSWAECRGIWDGGKGFGEIRRRRRDRHEPVDLWLRQSPAAGVACDRSRCFLRRRRTSAGHRHHHARHQLPGEGAEESGRACADARPRRPFRRHHRSLAPAEVPDLCDEILSGAVRGQVRGRAQSAKNPGHGRAVGRPDRARALWRRIHPCGAFDSGIACACDSYGGGNRASYRRLEAGSNAGHGAADRRAAVARAWRRRRNGADRRFHERSAGRPLAVGNRSRKN